MKRKLERRKSFIDWFINSNGATSVAVVFLGFHLT